jgi:hypothetical protein
MVILSEPHQRASTLGQVRTTIFTDGCSQKNHETKLILRISRKRVDALLRTT